MATASDLQQLYVGYFGRAADQAGLNFWLEAINNGGLTLENVHTSFVQSAEYTAKYTGLTSAALVAQVYLNVLGRPVDAAGQTFWANAIDTGVITEAQLIEGVLSGLSAGDQAIINNKVTVANFYTAQRGADFNTTDIAASANILTPVNGSTASVSAALTAVAALPGAAANSAQVVSALNNYLAAVKAQEDFAKTVIDPGTKKAVVDGNGNGSVIDEATGIATAASTTAFSAATTAATAATTGAVVTLNTGDSAAVTAAKLADATAKAAAAVTVAQGKVDAVAGLNAAVKAFDAALVTYTAADTAATAALTEQTAELAKFNSINGGAAVTVGAAGVVTGVTIVEVSTGNLIIDPAYATANAAAPAKLAAANDLLVDIKANLVAVKALADANTAVDAAGAKVADLDTTVAGEYDAALNKFTSGLAFDLSTEKAEQAALTKAITDLNAANALSKQLADLATATTNADNAVDTVLAGGLVNVVAATAGTPGSAELFVFNAAKFVGPAVTGLALQKGDFLSIGTGYTKGTDTDAVTAGIQGGNDSVLEVFFKTNAGNTEVVVEKSAFGSSATVPEIVTITLTGVTADKLAFDAGTGLISVA